jgi:FkbM family methyltransferase
MSENDSPITHARALHADWPAPRSALGRLKRRVLRGEIDRYDRLTAALIEAVQHTEARLDATERGQASANGDVSQHGEITELRALIRPGFPESIVDVGAYDGVSLSNSRPFLLEGWRGVLIEPHPVQFARLREAYESSPNVDCVHCACSDEAGVLPLFLGSDGPETMMSTLSRDENPWFNAHRSAESVEVDVQTLDAVLERLDFPSEFGILLVDAEGMDYEVLRGVTFERHSPRVIVTEEYLWNPEKHKQKYLHLLQNGYSFYKMVGVNTVWLRDDYLRTVVGV